MSRWITALGTRLCDRGELLLELIALRHQVAILQRTGTRRPCFRPIDRLFWIFLSRWWRRPLVIVQPATVLRWRRQGLWAILVSGSRGRWRGGRPRISSELRILILRMSHENFLWGAPRIHGELLKLGFDVSQASVSRYMLRRPFLPTQRWSTFLRNQALGMGAMGIFQVDWMSNQALAFIRCWRFRLLKAVFLLGTACRSLIKCSSLTSLLGSGVGRRYRPLVIFDPPGRRVTPYRSRASPTARPLTPAAVQKSRAGHSLRAAHTGRM
jgi:hypothetical protein